MRFSKDVTVRLLQKEIDEKLCLVNCHESVIRDLSKEIASLKVKKGMTIRSIEHLCKQLEENPDCVGNNSLKIAIKRELIRDKKNLKEYSNNLEEKIYLKQKREFLLEKANIQIKEIQEKIKKIERTDTFM